jgi:hypothetical protein
MVEYSTADVTAWMLGAFAVNKKNGAELQFDCPECDHPSCYFNVKKQVGFCHRATCRSTFPLDKLIDKVGYPPTMAGYLPALDNIDSVIARPVALPKGAVPIQEHDEAVDALSFRGVAWPLIQQFHIHQDEKRLYVPVYDKGVLVQYNSRRVDKSKPVAQWFQAGPKPYKYASGHPITNHFLGWEECRLWSDIVLVENTFVSMWLRDLHATATFGSHLSDTHIDKILHSNIKHVTFLWDEGTARASQKAQRKLKALGIQSKVINIKGQPDDHTKEELKELINGGHG